VQVIGNDAAVALAGSLGNLELNTYRPVIAHNLLQSAALLTDACRSFTEHCVVGLEPNRPRLRGLVERSLMLGTALSPRLGYDRAGTVAHRAQAEGKTLGKACREWGYLSGEEFARLVRPEAMIGERGASTPRGDVSSGG